MNSHAPLRRLAIPAILLFLAYQAAMAAPVFNAFDTNSVTAIELTISPAHWNELRYQHREAEFFPDEDKETTNSPAHPPAEPPEAYTWFPAELALNRTNFGRAEIRKKGYIGSNDIRRPSLKLRLRPATQNKSDPSNRAPDRELDLTLNNNRQDPSLIRQYLAYEVFRRAGIPAPRCSFVHLKINGKDLGIYTCVEPINAAFLQANFGSSHGNLYEGGRSDFRSNWVHNFSIKNNHDQKQPPRADLLRATAALEQTDSSPLSVLQDHFDADHFFRFWAVESLLNTYDGYAANMNNFYLYNNPATGKLIFIPWGADATFLPGRAMNSAPGDPKSVIGTGILAQRLYRTTEGAAQYRATLHRILDTAWNEDALLREVDRLESLLSPFTKSRAGNFKSNIENIRRFIRQREAEISPELDGPAPALKSRPLELAKRRNVGQFTGKFSASLRNGAVSRESVTLTGTLWNEKLTFRELSLEIQIPPNLDAPAENDSRIFIGLTASTAGQQYYLQLAIDPDSYTANKPIPINNTHIMGYCGTQQRNLGMLRGTLLLTKAPTALTGEISGEFTADLFTKHPKP